MLPFPNPVNLKSHWLLVIRYLLNVQHDNLPQLGEEVRGELEKCSYGGQLSPLLLGKRSVLNPLNLLLFNKQPYFEAEGNDN